MRNRHHPTSGRTACLRVKHSVSLPLWASHMVVVPGWRGRRTTRRADASAGTLEGCRRASSSGNHCRCRPIPVRGREAEMARACPRPRTPEGPWARPVALRTSGLLERADQGVVSKAHQFLSLDTAWRISSTSPGPCRGRWMGQSVGMQDAMAAPTPDPLHRIPAQPAGHRCSAARLKPN